MLIRRYLLPGTTILGLACILFSCQKVNLEDYHGGNSISFQKHSTFLSFRGLLPEERMKDTLDIGLAITGDVADYDRFVSAVAVEDTADVAEKDRKTTAVPEDYRILGGVVKAGQVYGILEIELRNTPRLAEQDLKLRVKIEPSGDFELGLEENTEIDITWTQKLLQPKTWNTMRTYFCATYSTLVYKTIISVTGIEEVPEEMTKEELRVWGRKFGDYVRQYEQDHGEPMLHDDGAGAGSIIIPQL